MRGDKRSAVLPGLGKLPDWSLGKSLDGGRGCQKFGVHWT